MVHVLLIGGFKSVIEGAKKLSIRLSVVDQPGKLVSGMDTLVERAIITDYTSDAVLIPLLKRIHEEDPFDMVLSFTEAGLLLSAEISEALDIAPSVPKQVVERTRNKMQMREVLATAGLTVPFSMVSSVEEVRQFIERFDAPVIVKPASGVGSHDVFKLNTLNDVSVLEPALSKDGEQEWIAEKFLVGDEYSVEAFSFDGNHVILSIHAKEKAGEAWSNPFVEIGHHGPAPLSEKDWEAMSDIVSRCLDAVGYRDGPSHTEIILTEEGSQIVETHTRVGGDRIFHLVKLSTGIDMFELALAWMCLRHGALNDSPPRDTGAAIRFFVGRPGQLKSIKGVDTAREMTGVVEVRIDKYEGDTIPELRGSEDRIGHVICTGATSQEAQARCEDIVQNVVSLEISG